MEGRFPPGVRLVFTNCTVPSRESEFNHWYDHVHLPDMLGSGVARHGVRYQNADAQPRQAKYLAIYEIERDDLDGVDQEFSRVAQRLTQQGRMDPALEIVSRAMWRRIGPEFTTGTTGEAKVAGIWMIQSNCADPTREKHFNSWYDQTHIPDLLRTGLFQTAYRFEAPSPRPAGKYLAIYETVTDPVQAVEGFARAHRPRLREAGRLTELIEVTWRGVFRQLPPP